MRYTKNNNRIGHEGTRPGWNDSDITYLNKHTTHTPSTQIWSTEELESAAPEDRRFFCAMCKSPLEYLNGSNTIWECSSCLQFYDTTIQDSPLKDNEPYKLRPYTDLQYYPEYDEDDPNIVFVEGIDLNTIEEQGLEDRRFEDQRIQHIHVKGSFVDALTVQLQLIEDTYQMQLRNGGL